MKRAIITLASSMALVVGLMAVPAHADQGQECQDFHHDNGNQIVTVCISINFTHNNSTNNVHFQYRDGKGDDVYYLDTVTLFEMQGGSQLDERLKGNLPIYATFSDSWDDDSCLYTHTDQLWGLAEFNIEWTPGVISDLKSISSDFVTAAVCM